MNPFFQSSFQRRGRGRALGCVPLVLALGNESLRSVAPISGTWPALPGAGTPTAAGVRDVFSKSLGSTNKINNASATVLALQSLKVDAAEALKADDKAKEAPAEVSA